MRMKRSTKPSPENSPKHVDLREMLYRGEIGDRVRFARAEDGRGWMTPPNYTRCIFTITKVVTEEVVTHADGAAQATFVRTVSLDRRSLIHLPKLERYLLTVEGIEATMHPRKEGDNPQGQLLSGPKAQVRTLPGDHEGAHVETLWEALLLLDRN